MIVARAPPRSIRHGRRGVSADSGRWLTPDALPDRIAEARQPGLDTLAGRPVDGCPRSICSRRAEGRQKSQAQVSQGPLMKVVPAKKAPARCAAGQGAAATSKATGIAEVLQTQRI